jgi:hypothetical protein
MTSDRSLSRGCGSSGIWCSAYSAVTQGGKATVNTRTATLLLLLFAFVSPSKGQSKTDPANFPLKATVLSAEDHIGSISVPTENLNTGEVTGTSRVYLDGDREEIQVGDTIYITEVLGHGGLSGKVGDSFPAQLGRKRAIDVLRLLEADSHGKPTVMTLEIIGERASND